MSLNPFRSTIKCIVVGNGTVGKTCLLWTYITGTYDGNTIPTVFDSVMTVINVNGMPYNFGLMDTAGQEDYDRIRPLAYTCDTSVVIMCFAVDSRVSFVDVAHKWYPEIRHYLPDVPIILAGTKQDLRSDPATISKLLYERGEKPVSYEEGLKMAKSIGAAKYVECSALKSRVKHVFDEAIVAAVMASQPTKPKRRHCIIL